MIRMIQDNLHTSKSFTLITSTKSSLPHKVAHSQDPMVGTWTFFLSLDAVGDSIILLTAILKHFHTSALQNAQATDNSLPPQSVS